MQTEVNKSGKVINLICKLIFDLTLFICGIIMMAGFQLIIHAVWPNISDVPSYVFAFLLGFTWWGGVDVIHKHFNIFKYV